MSLTDNLAEVVKDIFFTELLAMEARGLTIDNNLADEFDNTNEWQIDLVDGRMALNKDHVDLMKMTIDCIQK